MSVTTAALAISPLREDETEAAVALWDICGLLRPWNDPRADIALARSRPSSDVLAGRIEGVLVATVMVGHDGHRGWVYYLAVAPSHRKRGFGAAVMRAAEDWCQARGVPKLQLMVRGDNAATRDFYAAIGYERGDVVVMAKFLNATDHSEQTVYPHVERHRVDASGTFPMLNPIEKLLEAARSVRTTDREREEMRRSFAFGNTAIENSRITREMIDREADRLDKEKNERKSP